MVDEPALGALLARQAGVLSRSQALAVGMTRGAIRERLRRRRWQVLHPGAYAAFTGPVPRQARFWAAVLAAGPGAVCSHESAAELHGFADRPVARVHVCIPQAQRQVRLRGVRVHRSRQLARAVRPDRSPPRTTVEETVLDLTQTARTLTDAYGWIARAVNAGVTTVEHLGSAIRQRPWLRRRRLLLEGLGFVAAGCRSVLEISYLRDVERAHALPAGERQVRVRGHGRDNYLDVRYRDYRVRVELDGRAAHPPGEAHREMARDNAGVMAGDSPLRYGTADVVDDPCQVASQVARVLRDNGWTGTPVRCRRPGCDPR